MEDVVVQALIGAGYREGSVIHLIIFLSGTVGIVVPEDHHAIVIIVA
jgi:hypothetical protein